MEGRKGVHQLCQEGVARLKRSAPLGFNPQGLQRPLERISLSEWNALPIGTKLVSTCRH